MSNRLLFVVVGIGTIVASAALFHLVSDSTGQSSHPLQSANETSNQTNDSCTGQPTISQAEGPYYQKGSPERNNIAEEVSGEKLIVTGYVYDTSCHPIENAWLDFWQADQNGEYDNHGFNLRGHQFTDENGMYYLETVIPADYGSRPPHIHVKVRPNGENILTTQLYFPRSQQNQSDSILNSALLMNVFEEDSITFGEFNFIVE